MAKAMPFTAVLFLAVIGVWSGAALRLARTMAPEQKAKVLRVRRAAARARGRAC